MSIVTLGAVQLNVNQNIETNLRDCGLLIKDAKNAGAEFIFTPENTDFMGQDKVETNSKAFSENNHPGITFFSELAKSLNIWLHIGSMKVRLEHGAHKGKLANRSFLFRNTGQLAATYDKIHLYDVDLPNQGESHRESDSFVHGDRGVIVNTPWKRVGMSICYDVRFPYLYREMAQKGAEIMAVPAAFTAQTGQAHWEVLLRARAIETGSFVVAAAQVGDHPGERKTHGHTMIISPWGQILAEHNKPSAGFITRKVNLTDVYKVRSAIPSLTHDREYEFYDIRDVG